MYQKFFNQYCDENRALITWNSILTTSIFPMEVILLSWLSGMIFLQIKKKDLKPFLYYTACFFVMLVIIALLYAYSEHLDSKIVPSMTSSIRQSIFALTTNKKVGVNAMHNGEMITKLIKIPSYIFQNYNNAVTFIVPLIFSILFFSLYMYYVHWQIGIVSTVFFTVFCVCYVYIYWSLSNMSYHRFRIEASLMNEFEDVLKNNENIILNNTVDFEKKRMMTKEIAFQNSFRREMRHLNGVKMVFILLLLFYMFFIIFYCATLTMKDRVPATKLVMLTTAVVLMVRSISSLIRRCTDSIMEVGPLLKDNVFGELIAISHIHKGDKKNFMKEYRIDVRNVKFTINKKTILEDVSLTIPFRTSVIITGEIGTGKSTLLKLISGYFYATSGDVFFDGVSIRETDIEYLRENITMMHQHITMFKRSVVENIFYGIEGNRDVLMGQLKKLAVYPYVTSFLHAPDATKLSGGQRQIVLLLRCLFRSPKILMLDEPTANMDPATKSVIMNILDMLKQKMTLLAVSHDSSIFSHFDIKYIMKNGRLVRA